MEGVGGQEGPDRTQNETGLLKTGAGLDDLCQSERLCCVTPSAALSTVDPSVVSWTGLSCPVLSHAEFCPCGLAAISHPLRACRLSLLVDVDGLFTTRLVYIAGVSHVVLFTSCRNKHRSTAETPYVTAPPHSPLLLQPRFHLGGLGGPLSPFLLRLN